MKRFLPILLLLALSSEALAVWPLNGTSQSVSIADSSALTLPAGDWTMCLWVKLDALAADSFLISWDSAGGTWLDPGLQVQFKDATNKLTWDFANTTSARYLTSSTTPGTSTEWQHILAKRDGEYAYLWIGGTQVATSAAMAGHGAVDCDNPMRIGGYSDGSLLLDGSVAEIAFWSGTAMTQNQIEALAGVDEYAGDPQTPDSDAVNVTPTWYIDAYDGVDCQIGSLSLTNNGSVTATTTGHPVSYDEATPIYATSPSPADEATNQNRAVKLSWTDDVSAVSHDLYGGTNPASLTQLQNDSTQEWYVVPNLSPGVYYWRVDEIDAESNVTTGVVWEFTVVGKVGARE